MKNFIKKLNALLIVAVLTTSLYSCGGKSSESDSNEGNLVGDDIDGNVNLEQDNMPYGATMTSLNPNNDDVAFKVEYDHRFLTADEAKAVADYFEGVSTKNAEKLESVFVPYILEQRLELNQLNSTQDYADGLYNAVKRYTELDFDISFININAALDASEHDFSSFDSYIFSDNPDAKITSRHFVSAEIYYNTEDAKSCSLYKKMDRYIQFGVYVVDGKTYIIE